MVSSNHAALSSTAGIDPFAPLDAQIGPMGGSVAAGAGTSQNPLFGSTNQGATLRESVPQEFAGFDIPEPDPLPETTSGILGFSSNLGQFPM